MQLQMSMVQKKLAKGELMEGGGSDGTETSRMTLRAIFDALS